MLNVIPYAHSCSDDYIFDNIVMRKKYQIVCPEYIYATKLYMSSFVLIDADDAPNNISHYFK